MMLSLPSPNVISQKVSSQTTIRRRNQKGDRPFLNAQQLLPPTSTGMISMGP